MNIAIVGSGHGGCAAAAYYAKQGQSVSLLKIGDKLHNENFEKLKETKSIVLKGIEGEGIFTLYDVTTDIKTMISSADIIFLFYVTNFHEIVAQKIAPFIKEGQLIYLCPGYAGSLIFRREMKKINNTAKVAFVEGETLPFTSRIIDNGIVKILSKNYGHPIATLPKSSINVAMERLSPLLDNCIPRNNILEVALHNPNMIIHTIGIVMNAAMVESAKGDFAMYTQGFTPSIWKIVKKLDEEKMNVIEKVGGMKRSYFDEFVVRTYPHPEEYTQEEGFRNYAESVSDLKTSSLKNRYVTEDVPMGLGLLHSLGRHLNIRTPICDSIIHLASVMNDTNYFAEARTIESLGYSNIAELLKVVNTEIAD